MSQIIFLRKKLKNWLVKIISQLISFLYEIGFTDVQISIYKYLITNKVGTINDIKNEFNVGEVIEFSYNINSDTDEEIIYRPRVSCPSLSQVLEEEKSDILESGQTINETYKGINIDDSAEPQTCKAYVELIWPESKAVSKEFYINTDPSFDFSILLCKDEACVEKTKIFIKDEVIFLDYELEVENPLKLLLMVFAYMPAHIEITHPENIKLTNDGFGGIVNELARRLHGYDEVARVIQIEKNILEKKLKTVLEEKEK